MSTYGSYRDDTAHALAYLLDNTAGATTLAHLEQILGCRDIALTSLQRQYRLATGAAPGGSQRLPAVAANPTAAFAAVLEQLPRVGPRHAPTDVLTPIHDDSTVQAWQHAARSSLLATDVLESTHAWRLNPEATWAVVADTATATSALAVLDRDTAHLADRNGEQDTARALHAGSGAGVELLAALTAAVARRGRLHPGVDRLARPSPAPVTAKPLREFADAAEGQRRVAALLQRCDGVLPTKTLGPVLAGQARIAVGIAHAAAAMQPLRAPRALLDGHQSDTAAALAGAARARAEALTTMARARKGVADALQGGEPIMWQTAEVVRALARRPVPTDAAAASAQLRELQRLAECGDTVQTALARGVSKAFAGGHYLVPHPDANRLQWRPCTPEADPLLRQAAEELGAVLQRARLPLQLDQPTRPTPAVSRSSATQQLADALTARMPARPSSPGMSAGQPLSF